MLTGPLGDVFAEMTVEEYERTSRGVVTPTNYSNKDGGFEKEEGFL